MRRHIRPVTTACHQWHNAGVAGTFAFQPGPHVTKSNFDNDPHKIEGEWSGLYSYLGWADFEALRDGNPAVLRANRSGQLRDYLGGPQHLTIRLKRPGEKQPLRGNNVINIPEEADVIDITGEGRNGGSFTFNGKLRKVYLPKDVFGQDMHLHWRLTFVKTYANGENSWTRWVYDGIYCPGICAYYFSSNREALEYLAAGEMEQNRHVPALLAPFGYGQKELARRRQKCRHK